jgi:hypothetical protein
MQPWTAVEVDLKPITEDGRPIGKSISLAANVVAGEPGTVAAIYVNNFVGELSHLASSVSHSLQTFMNFKRLRRGQMRMVPPVGLLENPAFSSLALGATDKSSTVL